MAVTAVGTSCRRSDFFCAVTMISCRAGGLAGSVAGSAARASDKSQTAPCAAIRDAKIPKHPASISLAMGYCSAFDCLVALVAGVERRESVGRDTAGSFSSAAVIRSVTAANHRRSPRSAAPTGRLTQSDFLRFRSSDRGRSNPVRKRIPHFLPCHCAGSRQDASEFRQGRVVTSPTSRLLSMRSVSVRRSRSPDEECCGSRRIRHQGVAPQHDAEFAVRPETGVRGGKRRKMPSPTADVAAARSPPASTNNASGIGS